MAEPSPIQVNRTRFETNCETLDIENRVGYQEPKKINRRVGPNESWVDIYVYADPDGGGLTGFGSMLEPATK